MLIESLPTLEEKNVGARADRQSANGRPRLASGPPVALEEARPGHWVAPEPEAL